MEKIMNYLLKIGFNLHFWPHYVIWLEEIVSTRSSLFQYSMWMPNTDVWLIGNGEESLLNSLIDDQRDPLSIGCIRYIENRGAEGFDVLSFRAVKKVRLVELLDWLIIRCFVDCELMGGTIFVKTLRKLNRKKQNFFFRMKV